MVSTEHAERHNWQLWLRSIGCDAFTASDFRTAKRFLDANPPDVLVTAVRLGAYNGLHLAIHGRHRNTALKAIVIGPPDPVLQHDARAIDACYLEQPVSQVSFIHAFVELFNAGGPVRRSPRKRVAPIPVLAANREATLVDVSYDGLRVDIPGTEPSALPRVFTVRLADAALELAVQWVWCAPRTEPAPVTSYGMRLAWNDPGVHAQWRSLVDTTSGAVVLTT